MKTEYASNQERKPHEHHLFGTRSATFSALAYDRLAALCGGPAANDLRNTLALAAANEDVLPLLLERGGYGAIAMETKAEGRVDPPVNSFIELLRGYPEACPIEIIGALRMKIHFTLMVLPGTRLEDIKTVIAHPKAIGACRQRLKALGVTVVNSPSNGKAAEDVSKTGLHEGVAALGPAQAAQKYGLEILDVAFEDMEAITTFFYLGPRVCQLPPSRRVTVLAPYRALTVFQVKHQPGALVKVLRPFEAEDINLRLIHSLHVENGTYHFAIESESGSGSAELAAHERRWLSARTHGKMHPVRTISGVCGVVEHVSKVGHWPIANRERQGVRGFLLMLFLLFLHHFSTTSQLFLEHF